MPSDVVVASSPNLGDHAFAALASRIEAFHSAVALAEEEVRSYVAQQKGRGNFRGEQALIELGPFALGRIDPERFALLLEPGDDELTPEAFDLLGRADAVLSDFSVSVESHRVRLEPGGDLRDAVKAALAHVGRVFGASRAVELARAGIFDPVAHGHLLGPLPFRLWNRAERQLAPPLLIELSGDDCFAAGLGEFLDGNVTIVLVASGATTSAPLARLITPGTFVMQTADPEALARIAETRRPVVALVFDQARPEQAHFVHDPDVSPTTWGRLEVSQMPDRANIGRGRGVPAWVEEIEHLRVLATPPTVTPNVAEGPDAVASHGEEIPPQTTSADRLASWLLSQTDLQGL